MVEQPVLRAEQYQRRQDRVVGWDVGITSYKLGDRYVCEVDNVSPGAQLARCDADTREAAEREALRKAERRLARTRIASTD
jgi:hypothetical protein